MQMHETLSPTVVDGDAVAVESAENRLRIVAQRLQQAALIVLQLTGLTRSDAETIWREASEQDRFSCCTRFTVVEENASPKRRQESSDVRALASCVANDHAEGFIPHG